MKKALFTLAVVAAMSTVAFAQFTGNAGNTTTSKTCTVGMAAPATGVAPVCQVTGQTLLQAIEPEGITLTVPNEIDFVIIPGTLSPGNKPLTALMTWNLKGMTYTTVMMDSWFDSTLPHAMTATDLTTGGFIDFSQIVGQIGNNGPQVAFDGSASAYNTAGVTSVNAFPLYEGAVDPTTGTGTKSIDLNLFIDDTPSNIPVLASPTAVYQGIVYTTAAAI